MSSDRRIRELSGLLKAIFDSGRRGIRSQQQVHHREWSPPTIDPASIWDGSPERPARLVADHEPGDGSRHEPPGAIESCRSAGGNEKRGIPAARNL